MERLKTRCHKDKIERFPARVKFMEHSFILLNHNYNKMVKYDWLSTALISALIGQFNRKVRVMPK